ncbi:beta-lactamase-like protein [Cristinia sonorae]|uniref:Beta-lactamase-like protein n=1 Tax=Cristinia sonorae TaxID=1940300 RepID=A0A8K0XQ13_9AGAR|nr:beta-lactamase-like protein [Cristinia sonorae]
MDQAALASLALPSVSRLSKNVVRILGQNPGKFTLGGTNTYLVGQCNPYTLIDTGEGLDSYIPFLEQALKDGSVPHHADKQDVSDIIITHKHHDHAGGLSTVLALLQRLWDIRGRDVATSPYVPPRIHKFALPSQDLRLQTILQSLQAGTYTPNAAGGLIHELSDGQVLPVTTNDASESSHLHVIHTPGHTEDSLCLYLPADNALFTADTVLGYGTSVFEDLREYMFSLKKMIAFNEGKDEKHQYKTVYPGHGPVVDDGPKVIAMYLRHRVEREDQLIAHLKQPPASLTLGYEGVWTVWTLVGTIYKEYPKELWEPAAHNVYLHLEKLKADGRVRHLGGVGKDSEWQWLE